MIYADNAATTRLSPAAFEAMRPFLLEEYGNASQPYRFSRAAKVALRRARETIAECIHAEPEEIFFTSCGTESDNWALKGMLLGERERTRLVTSAIEHHAILHSAAALERLGYGTDYVAPDEKGRISLEEAERFLSSQTKLLSVMMVNNEVGTVQPIAELAASAHAHGAFFHTDAVQAVGHMPIDVRALDVDLLSCSGHKFNGPKGIGFLFKKKSVPLPPYMDGGSQESGMRAGTENVASIVGMAEALCENCEEMEETSARLRRLEQIVLSGLRDAGLTFIRNGGGIPGNLSLSFAGAEGEMLLHRLDLMDICVSTGSACNSKETEVSHVLTAMHIPEKYARGTIRVSFGRYNTEEEAGEIARALTKILKGR